ncbi:MAG: Ycf66 family protein [Cyanobacteria bacterium J06638_7]
MVNASLNWASIVGIVLAVGGALLYFMRSFKPALARDYDVFFAAVGLLCGGILFFQGWRLDPILQFGQFLLAGTTVFFAYESVRLRGVTTEQARRSAYFDDDEPMPAEPPYRPRVGGRSWDEDGPDRLDEPQALRRRIPARGAEEDQEDDFYRPRRPSRAAIPERAASRAPVDSSPRSYSAGRSSGTPEFGARRRDRDSQSELRRGSRPVAASDSMPRSSRRGASAPGAAGESQSSSAPPSATAASGRPGVPQGSPIRSRGAASGAISDADYTPVARRSRPEAPAGGSGRDNSSRFDD